MLEVVEVLKEPEPPETPCVASRGSWALNTPSIATSASSSCLIIKQFIAKANYAKVMESRAK